MIILNFHGVGPLLRDVDPGEHECWLDTDHFEAVLDLVKGDGRVRITFDDGNASDHEIAMPALAARKLKADFFICSGRIGKATFLDERQIHGLIESGMEIGSHGVDHRAWRTLRDDELMEEAIGSREALRQLTGCPVERAACPFGAYDRRVLGALGKAGYREVHTSDGGPSGNGWLRARNTVKRSTTIEDIRRMLARETSTVWRITGALRMTAKRMRPGRAR